MKRKAFIALTVVALLAAATGCTNPQGESEAPVFITVDLQQQPLLIDVENPVPLQIPSIELASELKDPDATDPQGFADTQIGEYTVTFFRLDGGTIVPPMQTFAAAVVVPSGGTATLENFPIMTGASIQQSPFDQLLPFNGGIDRETGLNEIHMGYRLTFFGLTVSGKRVQSQTAVGDFIAQ
jgi:hypothetical protein